MSKVVLQSETTTALERNTVHTQYDQRAYGMNILSRFIPFEVYIRKPGPRHVKAIVVFGPVTHKESPYSDFGVIEKKYQRVYTFNIRHYLTCYLPNVMGNDGNLTTPYTYNRCVYCGAALEDDAGHLVGEMIQRSYRPDKFIWQPSKVLQDKEGERIFHHHEGVI